MCFVVLAALGGCFHRETEYAQTAPSPVYQEARSPDDVRVYLSTPDHEYRELGMIEGRGGMNMSDTLDMMRAEAAKRGCDGVIITGSADIVEGSSYSGGGVVAPNTGTYVGGPTGSGSVDTIKGYRGICILSQEAPAKRTAEERRRLADRRNVSMLWSKGDRLLRTQFGKPTLTFVASGVPARHPKTVMISIKRRRPLDPKERDAKGMQIEGCRLQVKTRDRGTSVATEHAHESNATYETWSGSMPLKELAAIALSEEATATLCDTRFRIGDASRGKLASFVRLFASELNDVSKANDGDGSKQPGSDGAIPEL